MAAKRADISAPIERVNQTPLLLRCRGMSIHSIWSALFHSGFFLHISAAFVFVCGSIHNSIIVSSKGTYTALSPVRYF